MLNIQVLGKGLIPRGYGLAPRKEPFAADYKTIEIILQTPGLIVNMVNPVDNHLVELNARNLRKMWNAYGKSVTRTPPVQRLITTPAPQATKTATVNETPTAPVVKPETVVKQEPAVEAPRPSTTTEIKQAVVSAFTAQAQQPVKAEEKKTESNEEKSDDEKKEENSEKPTTLKVVNKK